MFLSRFQKRATIWLAAIGIPLLAVGIFCNKHYDFSSRAVFSGYNGFQVTGMEFNRTETIAYLRIFDRRDYANGLRFYNFWHSGRPALYVGDKQGEKKQLMKMDPTPQELREKYRYSDNPISEDEVTLSFDPVANPGAVNTFVLDYVGDAQIQSANSILAYIPILRSIPPSLFIVPGAFSILIVIGILAYAYLDANPKQAAQLKNAGSRIASEAAHVLDPKEVRQEARAKATAQATQQRDDELQMAGAHGRAKRDTQFQTVLRMAKDLDTIETIQEWRKNERRKVLNDSRLDADEKDERLELIDRAARREKERLAGDVAIYEDGNG